MFILYQSIISVYSSNNTCHLNNDSISINTFLSNRSATCSKFNIGNGVFILKENSTTNIFSNRSSLTITGNGNTIIECAYNAGFAFKNVSDMELKNITFHKCGMVFNSTSENPNSPDTTLTSKAALLFQYCINVSLKSVVVKNSDGVGVQMYNTKGTVNILYSTFTENKIKEPNITSGGGGVYIEFSLCDPGTNGNRCISTNANFTANATYEISFSNFTNNTATVTNPEEVSFLRSGYYTHFAFGRGGGLSVYIKGNASCNTFKIESCHFEDNVALFGAGMFVELQDASTHNMFTIQNSLYISNKVISIPLGYTGTSGGGVMLDYVIFSPQKRVVLNNSAIFINSNFTGNAAYNGGGFSFHSSKETKVSKPTNVLHFTRCHWSCNTARLGAAIDLGIQHSSENGQLVKPLFRNCTFINNKVTGFTIDDRNDTYGITDRGSARTSGGYWPGAGAMYLDALTVDFEGNVTFVNNIGGAIVAIDAGINVHQNACVNFTNNHAESGGALYLAGYSWISVSPHVQVSLINNSAREYGGAIYYRKSGEHDLMSSANCFIRYTQDTVGPYQWNVSFQFDDNCASVNTADPTEKKKGDAIYTTTVVDCAWNGSFNFASNATLKEIFLKWPNFTFNSRHNLCTSYIQTAARTVRYNGSSNTSLSITPGEVFKFPFMALNDFDELTSTIFMIYSDNKDVFIPNPVVQTNGRVSLKTNNVGNTFYLQFETINNRKHVGYILVTVKNCPMGYVLHNNACECITSNKSNSYEGLAYCNSSGLEIYIRPGYWAGYVGQFFSTYACPFTYCIETSSPIELNNNSDVLCNNRMGRLCGDCKDGYGLSVGTLDCVNCTGSHVTAWIILITTTYVPITIVFILLLVLNINLAVGPIHSFIFFCQVFPAVSLDNNHWGDYSSTITVINDIHSAIINVMSLKFGMYFTTSYCLFPSMNNMDYYLLQYVSALYPLFIMAIILSIIRYCPGCTPARYL